MKKILSSLCVFSILVGNTSFKINAFNGVQLHQEASQKYKTECNGKPKMLCIRGNQLLNKVVETALKIKSGEITLPSGENYNKTTCFIKEVPFEDWWSYENLSKFVTFQILKYIYFNSASNISIQEATECLEKIKTSTCELINNDPNFSEQFKKEISLGINEIQFNILGITDDIPYNFIEDFRDLELRDGKFINLHLFKNENHRFPNFETSLPTLNKLGWSFLAWPDYFSWLKIAKIQKTNSIQIEMANLIKLDSEEKSDLLLSLMNLLSSKVVSYVMNHFEENHISRAGNNILGAMVPGDNYNEHIREQTQSPNISDPDEFRYAVYDYNYSLGKGGICEYYKSEKDTKGNASYWFGIANEKDKKYVNSMYKAFSSYVKTIKTNLIYPEGKIFEEKGLVGKEIELVGQPFFAESIADIIGLKVTANIARHYPIDLERLYHVAFIDIWSLEDPTESLGGAGSHLMSPYRGLIAHKFSLLNPEFFGFDLVYLDNSFANCKI